MYISLLRSRIDISEGFTITPVRSEANRKNSTAKSMHLSEFPIAQCKMQRMDSDSYRLSTLHALRAKSATFNSRAVRTIINISGCEYVLALCLAASNALITGFPLSLIVSVFRSRFQDHDHDHGHERDWLTDFPLQARGNLAEEFEGKDRFVSMNKIEWWEYYYVTSYDAQRVNDHARNYAQSDNRFNKVLQNIRCDEVTPLGEEGWWICLNEFPSRRQ